MGCFEKGEVDSKGVFFDFQTQSWEDVGVDIARLEFRTISFWVGLAMLTVEDDLGDGIMEKWERVKIDTFTESLEVSLLLRYMGCVGGMGV